MRWSSSLLMGQAVPAVGYTGVRPHPYTANAISRPWVRSAARSVGLKSAAYGSWAATNGSVP